jgi:hypothetical protein
LTVVGGFELGGGDVDVVVGDLAVESAMVDQSMYPNVAYSTSSRPRHGPCG